MQTASTPVSGGSGPGPEPKNRPPTSPQSPTNPIWQAALEKYYNELAKGGIKAATINKELWNIQSPDELLTQIEGLGNAQEDEPKLTTTWTKAMSQLQPILLGLSDFAALTAWVMGMNGKVAAVLWGSIRLIVKVCRLLHRVYRCVHVQSRAGWLTLFFFLQFAQPVLPDVVGTLEDLQRSLPRIRKYEEELPMTASLEKALFELYCEIVVFCAYAIAFFRNNPNIALHRTTWSKFSSECSRIIGNVRQLSRRVDEAADIAKLAKHPSSTETAAALDALQSLQIQDEAEAKNLPCYMIPYGLNLRFLGRSADLKHLREHLDPPRPTNPSSSTQQPLKAIGVHGLGGVGKSQLALQYANTSMDRYAVIAWIPSENRIKMMQALSEFATKLGLLEDGAEDDSRSVQRIRDWLNKTKRPYLLVFDNVESASLLDQIWPANPMARIILTTRSPSEASKRTGVTLNLSPFSLEAGRDVLQALTGISAVEQEEKLAVDGLCDRVGGLPLALMQLSDFIRDRGYSYSELLRLYDKSAERVYAKSGTPIEYGHTVLTTWDISLQNLSSDAKALQNLLAFFDPDSLLERLITSTKADLENTPGHSFLLDEFEYVFSYLYYLPCRVILPATHTS